MKNSTIKKIEQALFGISVPDYWPNSDNMEHYSDSISPPSYMVKLILRMLYGKKLPPGSDKSEWEVALRYSDCDWIIWDWKRYKWNISGEKNKESEEAILRRKIISATNILNSYIKNETKSNLENDNFSLQNNYHKSLSIYNYFKTSLEQKLSKVDKVEKGKDSPTKQLAQILNKRFQRIQELEHLTIALCVFFFSHTECIFDACFSLVENRKISYIKFKSLDWSEHFRLFIDIEKNSELKSLYNDLLSIRKYYRNIPIHSSPEFYFYIENLGMIPSDYENIFLPHMASPIGFKEDEASRIVKLTVDCLDVLSKYDSTKFGYEYAKSGLLINLDENSNKELKKHMKNMKDFESELIRRCEIQDAFDNMQI